ncbi:MAG: histidine phosphatase family protein, partial [Chloroflexi bacterium]|nr:histidine phosphatase family protein [Chloroflexota bacterium]
MRHGRTPEARPRRYRGQTGESLAPRGRWEAQQAAKRLQGAGVTRIVS